MCGIAGILRLHAPGQGSALPTPPHPLEAIPEAWLDILDDSIRHRGPDGAARFRDRAVRPDGTVVDIALVHRRLSIIDHAGGHQPMVHDGERLRPDLTYAPGETPVLAHEVAPGLPLVAVAFNGCIYNHRELRAELEAGGHRFETDHSDTEVLVHGWRAWGPPLFERLNGMSATAHWTRGEASLSLARDACGQKPLYSLHLQDGSIAFGSSASGLWRLKSSKESCAFNRCSDLEILSWIRFGYEQPENYGLIPVECVRPGETLVYRGPTQIDRTPHRRPVRRQRRIRGASPAGVDSLLQDAVRSHIEADVPISVFLSGGIDSALVAGISGSMDPKIECITVRMPEPAYDESNLAADTAEYLGMRHRIIDCDADPARDLIDLIETLGLPFGDSSLLPTLWVARAARSSSKVALSGDGADELFAGYERHHHGTLIDLLSYAPFLGRLLTSRQADETNPKSPSAKFARAARAIRNAGYLDLLAIFDEHDARELLGQGNVARYRLTSSPLDHDFDFYLPNDLLRKSDTASMRVALEVRAPFLDRTLVTRMRAVRRKCLMPNGERKGLLKQVARKYLPEHIINRPKQGFAIPVGEWFRTDSGGMRQLLHDHLRSADPFPGLADAGVEINMRFVERMLAEHDAAGENSINPWRGRDHSQRLYMLLVLSIWARWLQRVRGESVKTSVD